jgi:hypothetical protein
MILALVLAAFAAGIILGMSKYIERQQRRATAALRHIARYYLLHQRN